MAPISSLPNELIVYIVENVGSIKDLSHLAQANRRLYHMVNPALYKAAVSRGDAWPLAWAAHCGVVGTLNKILDAGADPNHQFFDAISGSEWQKRIAAARGTAGPHGVEAAFEIDEDAWDTDSDLDANAARAESKWSTENSDSDHPGTVSTRNASNDPGHLGSNGANSDNMSDDESDVDMLSQTESDADTDTLGFAASDQGTVHRRFNPLHLAARAGHSDIVEVLLERGADLHGSSESFCDCVQQQGLLNSAEAPEQLPPPHWTPLHLAICHKRTTVAKQLLAHGASHLMEVVFDSSSSVTALHHAAGHGLTDLVEYILEQPGSEGRTDVDVKDDKNFTPFYYAYVSRQWTTTIPLLLQMGANINVDTKMFIPYCTNTPLGEACRMGHFTEADLLVDLGADVMRGFIGQNGRGLSPLHMCAMPSAKPLRSRHSVVEEEGPGLPRMRTIAKLLRHGALLNDLDCSGDTPLMVAAHNHNVPALRALLKAGADLQVRNPPGRTALLQALSGPPNAVETPIYQHDSTETLMLIIQELLDHGGAINDADAEGNTVLHLAVKSASPAKDSILRILLNKPGSRKLMDMRNNQGRTPFALAFYSKNSGLCDVLVRAGCFHTPPTYSDLLDMLLHAVRVAPSQSTLVDFVNLKYIELVLDVDYERRLYANSTLFDALFTAGDRSALTAAEIMFKRGLPPLTAEQGSRLLFQAIEKRSFELAAHIVATGTDANVTNERGQCPLAALLDRPVVPEFCAQLMHCLLSYGADIHFEIYRSSIARPLTRAIRQGAVDLVTMMVQKQPLRGDLRALRGCYLHDAVSMREGMPATALPNEKIINALLNSGASITEIDANGDTPLSVLLRGLLSERHLTWRYHSYIRALFGPGVDVNHQNKNGKSIAAYLDELMKTPSPGYNHIHTHFLRKTIALVDAKGGKELKFLPRPRRRTRPNHVWGG